MKEPEYQPNKFDENDAYNAPLSKVATAFKRQDTEPVFRGDSFQQEDFDKVQLLDQGPSILPNMVLHLTGTCPTCR